MKTAPAYRCFEAKDQNATTLGYLIAHRRNGRNLAWVGVEHAPAGMDLYRGDALRIARRPELLKGYGIASCNAVRLAGRAIASFPRIATLTTGATFAPIN